MRNFLFVLCMFPLLGFSQFPERNILNLWDSYVKDCNELVSDTIVQTGAVNCVYKPVKSEGQVIHFVPVPIDTVWNKVECRDYKIDDYGYRLGIGSYGGISTSHAWISSVGYSSLTTATGYSVPKINDKITIDISRDKYCMIKKRKASWEDFWNRWLVEKKIIEFN